MISCYYTTLSFSFLLDSFRCCLSEFFPSSLDITFSLIGCILFHYLMVPVTLLYIFKYFSPFSSVINSFRSLLTFQLKSVNSILHCLNLLLNFLLCSMNLIHLPSLLFYQPRYDVRLFKHVFTIS